GKRSTVPEGQEDAFGEREDWTRLWTPGVERLRKVVHSADEPWTVTRDGRLKWLARAGMDVRLHGIDVYLQTIEGDSGTAAHWHMADELFYVLRGRGHTLEWQGGGGIRHRPFSPVPPPPPAVA